MSDAARETAASAASAAIEAEGLCRRYDDRENVIEVLRGVCLAVAPGESVAVIGESGTGKSTLLHLLGGLDRPDGGSVRVRGVDIYGLPGRQRTALRGLIPYSRCTMSRRGNTTPCLDLRVRPQASC